MPVSFTQKGYYEVWRDGQKISQHNREREATETITEHSAIHGDGDYEIRPPLVMAKAYGVISNQDGGDTTPPTTPGSVSASATSATTGTVTWTASTDNVGVAGYQVFVDGSPVDTTTSLSYGLTGLSPSTQYSVTVTAYDAAGNNSPAGGPSLFTTDANSAPVWSLGNQSYTTGDAVSINLDANCTDADGDTITYSLVSGTLPSGLALSGARNQTLSGSVDTVETANFTLGASDGIANTQTVALTFTVSAPDTTAPAAPTGLTITSTTSSTISLDWDDNAESDLNHYDVERSTVSASGPWGQRNASPITTSLYQDTGLNELTQYWYRVTATDDASNTSDPSSVVTDTTSAATSLTNAERITPFLSDQTIDNFVLTPGTDYPADPVTTNEVTVNTFAEFQSALNSNAQKINIGWTGGVTGNPVFRSNDIDVVGPGDGSAWINGALQVAEGSTALNSRIRVTGLDFFGTVWGFEGANDVLFDNCIIQSDHLGVSTNSNVFNGLNSGNRENRRVVFINCTVRGINGGGPDSFIHFTQGKSGDGTDPRCDYEHFLHLGCKFEGAPFSGAAGAHTLRFQTVQKTVMVDCYINSPHPDTGSVQDTGHRYHHESQDLYMADCVLVNRFKTDFTTNSTIAVLNAKYKNVTRLKNGQSGSEAGLVFSSQSGATTTGTVEDCKMYNAVQTGAMSTGQYTDLGGNTVVSWDGSTYTGLTDTYGNSIDPTNFGVDRVR